MDDESGATLSVGLVFDTGNSVAEVEQLQRIMDSAEAKIVRDAKAIEQATGGMIKIGGATAEVKSFASASTQAGATVEAAFKKATSAGESMSRQLRYQTDSLGMTKAAFAAFRAELVGNTELAERLRTQEAQLIAKRREAAAATEAEAKAVRDASEAYRAFEAAAKQGMAQYEAAKARAAAEAAVNAQLLERSRIETALARNTGVGRIAATDRGATFSALAAKAADDEARAQLAAASAAERNAAAHADLVAKVRASHDAQVADAEAAERLRMATDPLYAATKRLNAEIAESTRLYHNGATAPAEYARQQEVLATRMRGVTQQHDAMAVAGNKNAFAMRQVAIQIPDIVQGLATGQKPMTIFIQQGGQIAQIAMMAEGGLKGMASQLGVLALRMAPFAAAAAVAFGAFKAFQMTVDKDGELTRYRDSLGLTHKEMLQLSDGVEKANGKIKELGNVSVTAGDLLAGIWDTIADHSGADRGIDGFKQFMAKSFSDLLDDGTKTFAELYGDIVGTYRAVIVVWQNFPAAFGDLFVQGVNSAIVAINALVKRGTELLNGFIDNANKLPFVDIAHVAAPQIDQMVNQYKGAANRVATALGTEVAKATAEGRRVANGIAAEIRRNTIGEAEKRLKAEADALKANRTPKKPKVDHSGETLAREIAATEALIKGNYALADAYQVSDVAAFKAEVRSKAVSDAIKKQAKDVEGYVNLQMRLAVSQGAVDAAKAGAQLRAQADGQKAINDAVAAGLVPASQAATMLRDEAQLRPFLIKYAAAEGEAKEKLGRAIDFLRKQQAAANAEAQRAQVLADTATGRDQLERLRLEATLIGATNEQRAVAIAQLQAEQYARAHAGVSPEEMQAYINGQKEIAAQMATNTTAQDNYNNSLSYMAEVLGLINERAQIVGQGLSDAFGSVGQGISTALTALTNYNAVQEQIDQEHRARLKAIGKDEAAINREKVLYAKASGNAQLQATMQAIGGLKTMFKEHSTGYKAMEAIEKAYAVFRAIQTIKDVAAGAAKMFASLGPLGFAAVAAMVAVMAAFGVNTSSVQKAPPKPEDLQDKAGTGTVLGDSSAKSDSIARSLEIVAANTNRDLEYSNGMLKALRNIDMGIAKLAGTVAQQISVSGSLFDTSALKLGSKGSSGFLGLFASSTTRELWDAGLNFAATTVADVLNGSIAGSSYQTVQKVKKSSGFLGIGGGTKTTYDTTTGKIDGDITAAVANVIISLRDSLVAGADVIGLAGAQAILDAFQVNIGQVSLKDMTGEEIEEQFQAIFSKVGDQMAATLLPSLKEMQLVGEGLFETFSRVAREYQVVDLELQLIGRTFGAVGVSSIEARDNLVQLFGSLDEFVERTDFFRDQFLSDAEQIAPVAAAVSAEMARLGLAFITTRDQFKAAVLGLDLTTDSGRELYASLLSVAPAFDKVLDYQQKIADETGKTIEQTQKKFLDFAKSLRDYANSLKGVLAQPGAPTYRQAQAAFVQTRALATAGNLDALGKLQNVSKAFLDASKDQASTLLQYQRDVASVINAANQAADAAALRGGPDGLDLLSQVPATTGSINQVSATITDQTNALEAKLDQLQERLDSALVSIATSSAATNRILARADGGDYLRVGGDSDTPVYVADYVAPTP